MDCREGTIKRLDRRFKSLATDRNRKNCTKLSRQTGVNPWVAGEGKGNQYCISGGGISAMTQRGESVEASSGRMRPELTRGGRDKFSFEEREGGETTFSL